MAHVSEEPAAQQTFRDVSQSVRERNKASVSEILFVDPSVDDVETILRGLRPRVQARVLDSGMPAVALSSRSPHCQQRNRAYRSVISPCLRAMEFTHHRES